MIFTKVVITKCHDKLRKLSFMFFSEIHMIKCVCKILERSLVYNLKTELLGILNPDSLGVKKFMNLTLIIFYVSLVGILSLKRGMMRFGQIWDLPIFVSPIHLLHFEDWNLLKKDFLLILYNFININKFL